MRSLGGSSSSAMASSLSSEPSHQVFSIQSRQVQEEFLKERLRRLESGSDISSPSTSSSSSSQASPLRPSSPLSLTPSDSPSSPSSRPTDGSPVLSLSSPELLSELKKGQSLRRVPKKKGLTTIFSGRGRQVSGSSP